MAASTTASVVEAATTTKATAMTTRCLVGPTRGKCCCERRYPLCSIRSREEENPLLLIFGHLLARFPAVCVKKRKPHCQSSLVHNQPAWVQYTM